MFDERPRHHLKTIGATKSTIPSHRFISILLQSVEMCNLSRGMTLYTDILELASATTKSADSPPLTEPYLTSH